MASSISERSSKSKAAHGASPHLDTKLSYFFDFRDMASKSPKAIGLHSLGSHPFSSGQTAQAFEELDMWMSGVSRYVKVPSWALFPKLQAAPLPFSTRQPLYRYHLLHLQLLTVVYRATNKVRTRDKIPSGVGDGLSICSKIIHQAIHGSRRLTRLLQGSITQAMLSSIWARIESSIY